jgi:hypothetical protein
MLKEAVGLAFALAAMSAPASAAADECEAIAAGIAWATHLPAEASGHNAFSFDMLGIHSRMYLFCGAPQTTISARDYIERIPPSALLTIASLAASQLGKETPETVYAALSECVREALRSKDDLGTAELGSIYANCHTNDGRLQIDISPVDDSVP